MEKAIKIIAAFFIIATIDIAAVVYLNDYLVREDRQPQNKPIIEPAPIQNPAKEAGLHSQEAMVLAAMLDQVIKEARMRDTVVAQQLMRIQHKMEMHKQRMPLCPDCANPNPNPTAKHHYTKDDSR